MKNVTGKVNVHTVYMTKQGKVPSVTTVLGVLNKPALLRWANRLGMEGIDVTKYVDEKADIGQCCHYMIECDVKDKKPDLSIYSKFVIEKAENSFLKWLEWKDGKDIEFISSEMKLVSEKYQFGGTIDIYAKINGALTLLDIKTSESGIWPEMKFQTAGGYRLLLEENGYRVEKIIILRIGRDENSGYEEEAIENWQAYTKVFLLCRQLYDELKVAK